MELVPNQNSFGHMTRWLIHERYRPLAELPQGGMTVWGERPEPISLCPTDAGSIELIRSIYDELLPNFASRMFNVGCDETIDLGYGRSKPEVERRGAGRVYLDFLLQIYDEVKRRGHTMQFWGDIIMKYPELIPELPTWNNGAGISVEAWVGCSGNFELAIGYSRLFAQYGRYTARDWRALGRLAAHAASGRLGERRMYAPISLRTVCEYARKYLGVPYHFLAERVGWEWVLEAALRTARYVAPERRRVAHRPTGSYLVSLPTAERARVSS